MSKGGKAFDIRYNSVSYADIERDLAHDKLYPRTAAVSTLQRTPGPGEFFRRRHHLQRRRFAAASSGPGR